MAYTSLSRLLNSEFSLKSNILANFAGNGLASVISIVALPLYLPLIGIETYGLIGFFMAFQAILSILDLGLGTTITRELAIRSLEKGGKGGSRDLVRTSEFIYWGMAMVIAAIGFAAVPLFIRYVNPQNLSTETLRDCFLLMSTSFALQFPMLLYSNGLFGLQRQALVSMIGLLFSIIRNLGVLVILHFVSATPQAFFSWQVIVSGLHTLTLAAALWKAIPEAEHKASFDSLILRKTWRFTAGIGAISIGGVLVTQVDKVVLARILPLDQFGYYAIAAVVSGSLQRLLQPVFQAYFPKLSQLAVEDRTRDLIETYHQGCQLVATVLFPVSTVIVFFSREVMTLWQRNEVTVNNTYQIVALLIIGSVLNGLIYIPYALQLAYGRTRLHLISLFVTVIVSIPLTIVLGVMYGSIGVASVWIAINVGYVIIYIPLMHRHLFTGEKWKWYFNDVFKPASAAVVAGTVCRFAFIGTTSQTLVAFQLVVAVILVSASAFLASGRIRTWALKRVGASIS